MTKAKLHKELESIARRVIAGEPITLLNDIIADIDAFERLKSRAEANKKDFKSRQLDAFSASESP